MKAKVRYFIEKPGAKGPLYFWQPGKALRDLGWKAERLPDSRGDALRRAEALNAQVDAWRSGQAIPEDRPGSSAAPKRQAVQSGTVADLVRLYRASRFYPTNAKTIRGYEQNIQVILEWAADAPVAAIGPKRVQALYDSMRTATPSKANAVIGMLRILLGHAVREQIVRDNAAANPGLESLPQSGRLWPVDALSLFVETADRMGWHSMGTAVVINHWIGQRQGDILSMRRAAYRDGRFIVRQSKTAAPVAVPHSPWVARRVEEELSRQATRSIHGTPQSPLLFCESTGRQWKEDHFRHVFAAVRSAAANEWGAWEQEDGSQVEMEELQYMHLRHTAVTELAIAGCTVPQIAGITGHTLRSVEQILSRYLIRTSDLAAAATDKRLEAAPHIAALMDWKES